MPDVFTKAKGSAAIFLFCDSGLEKLAHNQVRDRLVTRTLRKKDWKVIRIWERRTKLPG